MDAKRFNPVRSGVSDPAETYDVLQTDAYNWLEMAEGLQLTAGLIWEAHRPLRGTSPAVADTRVKILAYIQSFMLLTAFSFENVYRGIASVTKPEGWKYLLKWKGGHSLAGPIAEFITIDDRERDLLLRLKTYLQWDGRYPIPMRADKYVAAVEERLRTSRANDLATSAELFDRLKVHLEKSYAEQQAREPDPLKRWP